MLSFHTLSRSGRACLSTAVTLSLTLSVLILRAQDVSSGIRGTVTDATLAAVPGAEVSIGNIQTGFTRSVVTDEGGRYVFTLLPVGAYTLRVRRASKNMSEMVLPWRRTR